MSSTCIDTDEAETSVLTAELPVQIKKPDRNQATVAGFRYRAKPEATSVEVQKHSPDWIDVDEEC